MRVVMGIPFLYPAVSYRGAARAAYHLAESLHELGHEITVLTTDVWDSHSRFQHNGFKAPFEIIRVPNLSKSMAYYCQFYTPMGILKYAERLLARSDVLHLHTFRNLLNDLLARTAHKQGTPYLLTGHGTIPRVERFFLIKRFYDMLIGRWQLENAAGYIAVSEAERTAMKQFGLPEEKILLIPNGVSLLPNVSAGAFRARHRLTSDINIVLFLGKITRSKGVQHVVKALKKLRDNTILVIAGNDMGYGRKIRQLVSELRLDSKVIWTGLLNDREKMEALADADVTVYPSLIDVFGFVAMESILAGTPVIVCEGSGCVQIIRQTRAGDVVPWANPDALALAIQRRLDQGKNLRELQNAQERIQRHFNWQKISSQTLHFYSRIIQRARQPLSEVVMA